MDDAESQDGGVSDLAIADKLLPVSWQKLFGECSRQTSVEEQGREQENETLPVFQIVLPGSGKPDRRISAKIRVAHEVFQSRQRIPPGKDSSPWGEADQ